MSAKLAAPRLGRGLAALFGDSSAMNNSAGTDSARQLPIDLLDPNPFQPRTDFNKDILDGLAASIRAHGMLQPILVRPHSGVPGRYQIVAGERRWRAAAVAGLEEVSVVCRDLSDVEAAFSALIENLQRENLNPIEEAEGYQRLTKHFGLTHQALGVAVNKSRAHVGNVMRLLTLPGSVRDHVRNGTLSLGHAKAILAFPDPAKIAPRVVKEGLSVRQTERLVQHLLAEYRSTRAKKPNVRHLNRDLTTKIGYRVKVAASPEGTGTLTIWFADLLQFDDLVARLTTAHRRTETVA
jgi:ParB family chromosome partitioning protein